MVCNKLMNLNFINRPIMPKYSQRCWEILQHPPVRNFYAAIRGKEYFPLVQVSQRYISTKDTTSFQEIHAELKNIQKSLEKIDNVWKDVMKEDNMHLDKVKGKRPSFRAESSTSRNRYFSNEIMKRFHSSAEVDQIIKMGKQFGKILEKIEKSQDERFPFWPMLKDPRRLMILSSIQKCILEIEAVITANSSLPISNIRQHDSYNMSQRWFKILYETDNPRVKRLIALLKAAEIETDDFQTAMGKFFENSIQEISEVPLLSTFELEEIKFAIQPEFDDCYVDEWWQASPYWDCAFKCVTQVLMKPLTEFST